LHFPLDGDGWDDEMVETSQDGDQDDSQNASGMPCQSQSYGEAKDRLLDPSKPVGEIEGSARRSDRMSWYDAFQTFEVWCGT
jgi:hypothetical protein